LSDRIHKFGVVLGNNGNVFTTIDSIHDGAIGTDEYECRYSSYMILVYYRREADE
jgi:hypothetical protein